MSNHLNDKPIEIWQSEYKELLQERKTLHKALELACEYFGDFLCWDKSGEEIDCSDKICEKCWKEYFMQKARIKNEE